MSKMMRKTVLSAAVAFGLAAANAEAAAPTDPQIAHTTYTAGQIDIAAARQALARSGNPDVRMFAREMVRDHEAVNKRALALLSKLHVKPEPNPTSASLAKDAKAKLARYAHLRGAAFDRAYVANEVAYHKTVNSALQSTLIPNAKNAELKTLLETGLALFREHQRHAEDLAKKVKA